MYAVAVGEALQAGPKLQLVSAAAGAGRGRRHARERGRGRCPGSAGLAGSLAPIGWRQGADQGRVEALFEAAKKSQRGRVVCAASGT